MATATVLPLARRYRILSLYKSVKVKRIDFKHNSSHAHLHRNIKVAVVGSGKYIYQLFFPLGKKADTSIDGNLK